MKHFVPFVYGEKSHCFCIRGPVFLLLLFSFQPVVNAQFTHKLFTSNMMIEGKFNYSFIYSQHLELELFNSHMPDFEISIQQETYGKHIWERSYGYPLLGISLWYSGLGRSPYLGDAYGLFPFINFPLARNDRVMVCFRFGLGVGYLTKKFDRITNYKNTAIGSHFNAAANITFEGRYKIDHRLTASLGFGLQHFSNGSLKLPNYGLNILLVNAGLAYRLVRENKYISNRFIPPTKPYSAIIYHTMELDFGAALGYKNLKAVYGRSFLVYHIYQNTLFDVSPKSLVGFGLDLSYDASHVTVLESIGQTVKNKLNILRPGINAAYELKLSRLAFLFNFGYYLGGQEHSNGPLYEKLSAQYNFLGHFFTNVMLKVHFGRADYIGWGLGYRFQILYGKRTIK